MKELINSTISQMATENEAFNFAINNPFITTMLLGFSVAGGLLLGVLTQYYEYTKRQNILSSK